MLNKNDLAMVLNDKTSSGDIIGSTILIDENDKYIYNQRTQRLICNDKILPEYAWCFLNNPNQRRKVFSYAQGGTQIYVNFSSIEKMNVLLPVDYKKQILISKLLINLDNKTNNEIIKLKKLHELKKGLMQNMFI